MTRPPPPPRTGTPAPAPGEPETTTLTASEVTALMGDVLPTRTGQEVGSRGRREAARRIFTAAEETPFRVTVSWEKRADVLARLLQTMLDTPQTPASSWRLVDADAYDDQGSPSAALWGFMFLHDSGAAVAFGGIDPRAQVPPSSPGLADTDTSVAVWVASYLAGSPLGVLVAESLEGLMDAVPVWPAPAGWLRVVTTSPVVMTPRMRGLLALMGGSELMATTGTAWDVVHAYPLREAPWRPRPVAVSGPEDSGHRS